MDEQVRDRLLEVANHGATWTTPIKVSAKPWGDKPWIGVSPDGVDVYIAYATSLDVWIAASHNSGASFAPAVKLNNDIGRLPLPERARGAAERRGDHVGVEYPGSQQQSGAIAIETWRTTNGGTSWTRTVIGNVFTGVVVETSSTTALASDARRYARRALHRRDRGGWAGPCLDASVHRRRRDVGAGRADRERPRGREVPRDHRRRGGCLPPALRRQPDRDRGTPGTAHRPTAGRPGAPRPTSPTPTPARPYKTAAGFAAEYGDYGAIDITNTGKTVAVWGEGASFSTGPGGIWFNRQL